MIIHREVVEVGCDDCGLAWYQIGGFDRPSWDTEAEAQQALTRHGWQIGGHSGFELCPSCRAKRNCADVGHTFPPPDQCRCGGTLPGHVQGCPQWQMCADCGHIEDV